MNYKNIIFDFGGVVFDWKPTYLYEQVFADKQEMDYFLTEICNNEWNVKQDGGRDWKLAEDILIEKYPKYEKQIKLYRNRWHEMLKGTLQGTVNIMETLLKNEKYQVFGLTNWSGQTFPYAFYKYDFLRKLKDIVVSGDVKMLKPNEDIYNYALERFKIEAKESIFIDDNKNNIETANRLGIKGIHFTSAAQLKADLLQLEIEL